MKTKISIRKVLMVTAWLAVGAGLLTLLIAASRKEKTHNCQEVVIKIRGVGESFFVDKSDISNALRKAAGGSLVGQPVKSVDLALLESSLEDNPWIRDADLYFDSDDVLHVTVKERQPIARIFTTAGNSFYIDTAALRMPVLEGTGIRVPVITNFIAAKKLNKRDSVLLDDVKRLALYVGKNEFWNAQVAQIDIVNGEFELIPTIGNHLIRFGKAEDIEDKFHRLLIFYKQVLSKTGFDKYSVVDVRYAGQIVGVHKGTSSAVDSLQLKKNIADLMKQSQLDKPDQQPMRIDSSSNEAISAGANAVMPVNNNRKTEKPTIQQSNTRITTNTKPNPISVSRTNAAQKKEAEKKKPKAVMRRPG